MKDPHKISTHLEITSQKLSVTVNVTDMSGVQIKAIQHKMSELAESVYGRATAPAAAAAAHPAPAKKTMGPSKAPAPANNVPLPGPAQPDPGVAAPPVPVNTPVNTPAPTPNLPQAAEVLPEGFDQAVDAVLRQFTQALTCLLYTSPSPRDS